MKRLILFVLLACMSGSLNAAPSRPVTVDYSATYAPEIQVYRSNVATFTVTVRNGNTPQNLTGYTPVMWWATSNTADSVVTAQCAVITATSGTFTATFNASDLNYAAGTYIYGIALSAGGVTTARQGVWKIVGDAYATGASAATFTSNLNINAYNWTGTFPSANIPSTYSGGLTSPSLTATTSAGWAIKASNGSTCISGGAGGGCNVTLSDGTTVNGLLTANGGITTTNGITISGTAGNVLTRDSGTLQCKVMTGTMPSNTASSVAHGLTFANIVSAQVMANPTNGTKVSSVGVTSGGIGTFFAWSLDATNLVLDTTETGPLVTPSVNSQPYQALIWYTP